MKAEIKAIKGTIADLQKKYDKSPDQTLGSIIGSLELTLRTLIKLDAA
jgi:hypothetical protein